MPIATNCVQLVLHDKRLSSALLAATNRSHYLKNAELINQKYNLLEISMCVAEVARDPQMPLDISVKIVRGLVEIYEYNLKSLKRSLALTEKSKISFKRKEIEIELHVKNKRLKENINSLNWDNLYCLDFDNDILTDEQIMKCLLNSKHQTSVQNIADITIREAPPAIAYTTIYDQDDDFGPVSPIEMEQLYFPAPEAKVDRREPLRFEQCEQDTHDVGFEEHVEPNNDINGNNADHFDDVIIQPLDNITMEMVPVDATQLPALVDNTFRQEIHSCSVAEDPNTPQESATACANNKTSCLPQSMQIEFQDINKICSKKKTANRRTKLSVKHMEQSAANYWKLQRKRPKEELLAAVAAKKAELLLHKPLRISRFILRFERFPKFKRPQHTVNRKLLQHELGLKSVSNRTPQNSQCTSVDPTAAGVVLSEPEPEPEPEPIPFPANCEPEIRSIGGVEREPPQGNYQETPPANECYVSDREMLSLLHTLWDCVPNGLPFDLVKSRIKNRFTAASVFAHLLAFSAKGIIHVIKGENGSPETLIKGSNWM